MKTPPKRAAATRKDSTAKKDGGDARERHEGGVASSVRQWAKENVKKSPVDTEEGGSGQP
jgi:hypothetical protein